MTGTTIQLRLQELYRLTSGAGLIQPLDEALDLLDYRTWVVSIRWSGPSATAPTVTLQHAAVLVEDAFTDLAGATFTLTNDGGDTAKLDAPLRYLRWKATHTPGSDGWFVLDVQARPTGPSVLP